MQQNELFRAETGVFVPIDDATGRIAYTPRWVAAALADKWFGQLRDGIAWRSERRMMYERMVAVPRLVAHFRLDDPALPAPLGDIAMRMREELRVPFDSAGLNFYRDQHDSVAPHNDKLGRLAEDRPIALLSLGATREMVIRAKQPPRHAIHLQLEPGSLLLMDYASQSHYDHGIPKQDVHADPRISVAFRCGRGQMATWRAPHPAQRKPSCRWPRGEW